MTAIENAPGLELTDDAFLGGRLRLLQPKAAYRAGLDAILLAAAAPVAAGRGERVLDAGAGIGTVGLAVAARIEDARVTLAEIDSQLAQIARENVARNGMEGRVRVVEADIRGKAVDRSALGIEAFEHVLANPPYIVAGRGRTPADPMKAAAFEMAAEDLEKWARFLARMTAPRGMLALIHRADALPQLLPALDGRFGSLEVLPVHPQAYLPAKRVLVRGRKGSRGLLRLLPSLVLHDEHNRIRPEIDAILRTGQALDFPCAD